MLTEGEDLRLIFLGFFCLYLCFCLRRRRDTGLRRATKNMFVVGAIYVTSLRNGSFGWNDLWSLNVQVALRATITKQLSPALPFSTCNFDFFTYFTLNSSHITKRVITGSLGNSFVLPRIRRLSVQSLLSIPKQTLLDVSRAPKDLFFSLKKKFEIHPTACWFLANSRQTPFSLAGPLPNLHSQQVGSIHWTLELI